MEKITLVAMLTDYDDTYEIRNIDKESKEEGEKTYERLFVSVSDGDKHVLWKFSWQFVILIKLDI